MNHFKNIKISYTAILLTLLLVIFPIIAFANSQTNKINTTISPQSVQSIYIGKFFLADEELFPFTEKVFINKLSINSGEVELKRCDSLVRVILVDENLKEYLIYEAYPLLCEKRQFQINNVCEETCNLDSIMPHSLKIQIINATIKIDNIDLSISGMRTMSPYSRASVDQEEWYQDKIKKLNDQIQKLGLKWTAGETDISKLSYEEKKQLFGLDRVPNLQGAEFYVDGIFEICSPKGGAVLNDNSDESMIDSFDWRNRHGANRPNSPYYDGDLSGSGWITSVKRQRCADCWAHSAVGATEAVSNLFFNQHIDLDLSEQELVSCANAGSCSGGNTGAALRYIRDDGIIDESCFPESGTDEPCGNKCRNPNDLIEISEYHHIDPSKGDEFIKKQLLEYGPLAFGISSWSHCMVLVGYQFDPNGSAPIWILKNSWGTSWGEDGYGRIKVDPSDIYLTYAVENPVISHQQSYEVLCLDRDGDGYYNWGISKTKPDTCPQDAPEEKDCDDSDPLLGPFDEYGHCLENPLNINSMVTFDPNPSTYNFTPVTKGCQTGAVGKFNFNAILSNISEKNLSNLSIEVDELTNNNMLLTNDGLIGEGEIFFITRIDRIEALIDGRSQLILKENTAQWYHLDYAAPGRHEFRNDPTIINGVEWFPVWPDIPDEENRDCNCYSDVFTGLYPPLPLDDFNIKLKSVRSRSETRIIQEPTNENDYTLVIEFNDNAPGGSDTYIVEVELEHRNAGDYSDGILGPGEYLDVPFTVCLQEKNPFRFFVNVLGVAEDIDLGKGLVAFYPFNGNANDESSNGNDGTLHGTTLTEDRFGNLNSAYSFDGDDDWIEVPSFSNLTFSELTFSVWLKIPDIGINNKRIFTIYGGDGHYYALQGNSANALSLKVDGEEVNEYNWSFIPNTWNHIVMTYDGHTIKAYKDGVMTESGIIDSEPVTGPLFIGETDPDTADSLWHGELDDIHIYNRVLSSAEIEALYNLGK